MYCAPICPSHKEPSFKLQQVIQANLKLKFESGAAHIELVRSANSRLPNPARLGDRAVIIVCGDGGLVLVSITP